MTKRAIHSILLAALLGSSACYTGFEADTANGVGDDGIDDADEGRPGGDDGPRPSGDGGDSDEDPEPAEEEEDPFNLPGTEARLLPFHVRMTNLATVLGVEEDHFIFDDLYTRRTLLGDHDFANGIAPDLAWNPAKMSVWVKGLDPVCGSAQFQERYPNVGADPTPLLRQILARDPDAQELAAYGEVVVGAVDQATADRLTCFAALSSLEFVAQ